MARDYLINIKSFAKNVLNCFIKNGSLIFNYYVKYKIKKPTISPDKWRKGLIISDTHIGDILYLTCSLKYLKDKFNDCEWYYLCSPYSSEVLQGNPFIKNILPYLKNGNKIKVNKKYINKLKEMNFDVALATKKYHYLRSLILALRLEIPSRVGYVHQGFSEFVTIPVPTNSKKQFPAYFRDYVAHLAKIEPKWDLKPQIFYTKKHKNTVDEYMKDNNLSNGSIKIAIFLTGITLKNLIPSKLIIEMINILVGKNYSVILCGTKADYKYLNFINNNLKKKILLNAGKFDILSLGYFLSKCNIVFCPDSGPRHLANAVGTPVLFYRNLQNSKIEGSQYCSNEEDIFNMIESENLSKNEFYKILSQLEVNKIIIMIEKMLIKSLNSFN